MLKPPRRNERKEAAKKGFCVSSRSLRLCGFKAVESSERRQSWAGIEFSGIL
jgi:hypothetical protein